MDIPNAFSIIVLYHSGESFLKVCLESIIRTAREKDEIIVVVNNKNEFYHNVDLFKERVRYLHFNEDLGHGKAANIGINEASNEYVILSDHDLVFFPNWIDSLWKLYDSNPLIAAVSCKVINTNNSAVQDFGIAYSDFNLGHPFMDLPMNHELVMKDNVAQMICTGGFMMKKYEFQRIGGFDEKFGTLYTDLDLCLRIKAMGKKVGAASNAIAYHFGGDNAMLNRNYKKSFLKADVKGVFMKKNADVIESDMSSYYQKSALYYNKKYGGFKKYFFCNMMNVVYPEWYEEIALSVGINSYDRITQSSGSRDENNNQLFETLGYDLMSLGVPILYFVDRFIGVKENFFWWEKRRRSNLDIVIDRNANILPISEVLI
ncbi:MAG: glycosyltransferase [Flavobacteriaceae bacterium]|nr:glycosyltransferase [Flavobacteriaceae bacterium]